MSKSDREKITMGICVSPLTVDRCPYCVDTCMASEANRRHRDLLEGTGIDNPKEWIYEIQNTENIRNW